VARAARSALRGRNRMGRASPFAIAAIALAFGRAVTARRHPQQEARRIFELSLDLICVVDVDGRFASVNPAFERTLGYPPAQMLRRPFADFVHPDDRDASLERLRDVPGGDEVTHFENRVICRNGSERWLEWSARAVPEERHAGHDYYNFADTPAEAEIVLPPGSYQRLQKIKATYDPDQTIISAHPVRPAGT
jgi:PAS domain S-box-containing protein